MWGRKKSQEKIRRKPSRVEDIQEQKKFRRRLRASIIVILIISTLSGGFYVFVASDTLIVKNFEVTGNNLVESIDILERAKNEITRSSAWHKLLSADNILLWEEQPLANVVQTFPNLAEVNIERNLLERKITLGVRERERKLIWCLHRKAFPEKCLWTDESGILFADAPTPRGNLFPVVHDYTDRNLRVGDNALSEEKVKNITSVYKLMDAFGLVAEEFRVDSLDLQEGETTVRNGPKIMFSFVNDAQFAKPVIESLKNSGEWERVKYLDLRVDNRAYYSY